VASTLNPIFMLGGAPEAYEVSSKTPRVEFQSFAKFLPEAFPIKASDNPEGILKLALMGLDNDLHRSRVFQQPTNL